MRTQNDSLSPRLTAQDLGGLLSEDAGPADDIGVSSARSASSFDGKTSMRRRSMSSRGSDEGRPDSAVAEHADTSSQYNRGHRLSASAASSADIGSTRLARSSWLCDAPEGGMETLEEPVPLEQVAQSRKYRPDAPMPMLQPSVSELSLHDSAYEGIDDDDGAHLTTNMPFTPSYHHTRVDDAGEEGTGSQRNPRTSHMPLDRRKTLLDAAAKTFRSASVRVVNLAARDAGRTAGRIRIADDEDEMRAVSPTSPLPQDISPLVGKSLGIFGPHSKLRLAARSLLLWRWTEPVILALIIIDFIVLSVQSSPNVFEHPRPSTAGYFHSWEDWVIFALYVSFTIEMLARILVSGFLVGTEQSYRDVLHKVPFLPEKIKRNTRAPKRSAKESYELREKVAPPRLNVHTAYAGDALIIPVPDMSHKSGTQNPIKPQAATFQHTSPFRLAIAHQKYVTSSKTAYLRHSWNRIDFVAVIAFWMSFILAAIGWEESEHVYLFRMLSVLRVFRLLTITAGTTTILQSFQRAAPQLVSVAFFVLFAMILFAIIGVQGFKGSLRRLCVWQDPAGQQNFTFNDQSNTNWQHCGGSFDASGAAIGYISAATQQPVKGTKGFICPAGQLCVEGSNPYNNTVSFDNFFSSTMMVVVIASANTWTDIMYDMMDADFFASCLYFIICLIILNFWLFNSFVAVIINTFGSLTEQTKQSAFAQRRLAADIRNSGKAQDAERKVMTPSKLARWWYKTNLVWVALILVGLVFQATKTSTMDQEQLDTLQHLESIFTLLLDVEITVRFLAALPDWRTFFNSTANKVDAFLAFVTSIIQIPVIADSSVYPWLTFFQIVRSYRIIVAIPRMKRVLSRLWRSLSGLMNMIGFLLLMTFIAGLLAAQFIRGSVPMVDSLGNDVQMSFYQTFNSFLGMFQLFSSENWTSVLYPALGNEVVLYRIVIVAILLCGWLLFAYFIMLQMFIAVINEGWSVAEDQKHQEQFNAFVNRTAPTSATTGWLAHLNPYLHLKARPKVLTVEHISKDLVLPMRKVVVRDVVQDGGTAPAAIPGRSDRRVLSVDGKSTTGNSRKRASLFQRQSAVEPPLEDDDLVYQLDMLTLAGEGTDAKSTEAMHERRAVQADFITAHPTYDRSLWIFSNRSPLRKLCQQLAEVPSGERLYGASTNKTWNLGFRGIVFAAIVGSVTVAAIATPVYRQRFYILHGDVRWTWFNLTEVALGMLFVVEFLVKVIADGFIFTPNAYLLSVWNALDFFVLITLIVNIVTALIGGGVLNRFVRALNAFRALRLINLSDRLRETFYTVFIAGFGHIMDACIVALLYIIPFAIWGQNIFSGLLYSCNDGTATNKGQCQGEYVSSPLMNSFLAPRSWQNPYVWSYDSFRRALLIMFEIISLEGWINVLGSLMWIVGVDQQPIQDATQVNAIYLVIYMVVGASVILTLFVSVIIENFTKRSGMALLTTEQREWIDLRKLLIRQRPSKRPMHRPIGSFRSWCYDRAVNKRGWWSRMMTALYLLQILLLISQSDSNSNTVERLRNYAFLLLTLVYMADVVVRLTGLGWSSFSANLWNLYDVLIVVGTVATTLPILLGVDSQAAVQLQKLFLVAIAFKLVQKSDGLNQLFKVATASLPAIANLFLLWSILFITYILLYVEIFGLTRWAVYETWTKNYASFGNALIMLIMASTGEGWNGYMHDYTTSLPLCSDSPNFLFADCGSPGWSFTLAISWNILSMYIITNMFTAVVVENFGSIQSRPKSITREEMRSFKKVWAEVDVSRSGYIRRRDYGAFFAKLSGVFEVKIYPDEHQVRTILKVCRRGSKAYDPPRSPSAARLSASAARSPVRGSLASEVNIDRLNASIRGIDATQIAERRRCYSRLYYEAILSDDARRGMSFNHMLLLLAHYKLIEDNDALRLDELLQRKARKQRVEDVLHLERVRGLLRMIHWRKKFLRHLDTLKEGTADVPAIYVSTDAPSTVTQGMGLKLDLSNIPPAIPRSPSSATTSPRMQLTPRSASESPSAGGHTSILWGQTSPRLDDSARERAIEANYAGGWGDQFQAALEISDLEGS